MSENHVLDLAVYRRVFGALIALTVVTVAVAYVDLGPLNTPVALIIAGVKSCLVILIFMHVRWQPRLVWLMAGAGFVWLVVLLAFTFADVLTRTSAPGL